MIGQSITGTGIPSNSIITAVQVGNPVNDPINPVPAEPLNSVTISNKATATATGLALVIGATIDISQLMPGNLGWA